MAGRADSERLTLFVAVRHVHGAVPLGELRPTVTQGLLLQADMERCLIKAHEQLQAEAQRRRAQHHDLRFLRNSKRMREWERRKAGAARDVRRLETALPKLHQQLLKLRRKPGAAVAGRRPVKMELPDGALARHARPRRCRSRASLR